MFFSTFSTLFTKFSRNLNEDFLVCSFVGLDVSNIVGLDFGSDVALCVG